MKTKTKILLAAVTVLYIIGFDSVKHKSYIAEHINIFSPKAQTFQTDVKAKTADIYRTRTGNHFHRSGCPSLSNSQIPTTPAEAEKMHLSPCKICKPPQN